MAIDISILFAAWLRKKRIQRRLIAIDNIRRKMAGCNITGWPNESNAALERQIYGDNQLYYRLRSTSTTPPAA